MESIEAREIKTNLCIKNIEYYVDYLKCRNVEKVEQHLDVLRNVEHSLESVWAYIEDYEQYLGQIDN